MEINLGNSKGTGRATGGVGFIAGLMFLAAGLAAQFFMADMMEEAKASKTWPTLKGTVVVSEIHSTQSTDSDGREQTMYYPEISAQYEWDGKTYWTSGINVGPQETSSSRNSVRKKTAAYPVGSTVDVYYDPESPDYAVLEPGLPLLYKILIVLPYAALILGALTLLRSVLKLLGLAVALGFLVKKKRGKPPIEKASVQTGPPPETPDGEVGSEKGNAGDDGFSI